MHTTWLSSSISALAARRTWRPAIPSAPADGRVGKLARPSLAFWLSAVFLLSACAGSYRSPDDPAESIPDLSLEIAPGQTERSAVRRTFGEPFLASLYWQFDLFRASTEQTEVAYALTPWPVPFARLKDQLLRYTLVTYDTDGRAAWVSSGMFRKPAEWRSASPIESNYMDLHLRAGELLLLVDRGLPRKLRLMATPEARDRYLATLSRPGECTLILGCGAAACGDRVSVDGGEPLYLPLRIDSDGRRWADGTDEWMSGLATGTGDSEHPWLAVLVPLTLREGKHALGFSGRFLDGDIDVPLDCDAGDLLFGEISARAEDGTWRQKLVEWRVDFGSDMPPAFRLRPLVLTEDERWLLPPEPGDSDSQEH